MQKKEKYLNLKKEKIRTKKVKSSSTLKKDLKRVLIVKEVKIQEHRYQCTLLTFH
jgi:hypothetical protein